jgi:hypothetical protein
MDVAANSRDGYNRIKVYDNMMLARRLALFPVLAAGMISCTVQPPAPSADRAAAADASARSDVLFLVDDFEGDTDLEKINKALAAMGRLQGPKTLRFSPREYLIKPLELDTFDPVIGGACISNLVVEGNGAVLVAQDALNCRKGYFFKISRFEDLVVKDLTLTYRPTPFVQGAIVRADQPGNRTTLVLDPGYDHIGLLQQTPHSEFWCRVGIKDRAGMPKPDNPSWISVGVDARGKPRILQDDGGRVTVEAGAINAEQVLHPACNWEEGDPFVIWKRAGQDGFCFEEGGRLTLANVRVESALHFAIKLRGVVGARLTRCAVSPASGAMLSGSADGIDVQQSRDIVIEDCSLISTGDDAISFLNHRHGHNGEHYERKFAPPYPETNEGVLLRNNRIEGGNRNGILLLASRVEVISNTAQSIRQYGLKFAGDDTRIEGNAFKDVGAFSAYRHIEDELNTGVVCSDEWNQYRVAIRNNVIESWRNMPGILLKSVHHAEVTGNTFVLNDPTAIMVKPLNAYLDTLKAICVTHGAIGDSRFPCSDILIEGNAIRATGGWRSADDAIEVHGLHDRVVVGTNNVVFRN